MSCQTTVKTDPITIKQNRLDQIYLFPLLVIEYSAVQEKYEYKKLYKQLQEWFIYESLYLFVLDPRIGTPVLQFWLPPGECRPHLSPYFSFGCHPVSHRLLMLEVDNLAELVGNQSTISVPLASAAPYLSLRRVMSIAECRLHCSCSCASIVAAFQKLLSSSRYI